MNASFRIAVLLGTVLTVQGVAGAEAGWSEAARERSFWIKPPYALLRHGDRSMGPDTVRLVRADEASWSERHDLFGPSDIHPREQLVDEIRRYARLGDRLVMETAPSGGMRFYLPNLAPWATIDLANPTGGVQWLKTMADVEGVTGVTEAQLPWRTFEDDLYWEECWPFWPVALAGLVFIAALVAVRVRTRNDPDRAERTSVLLAAGSVTAAVLSLILLLHSLHPRLMLMAWLAIALSIVCLLQSAITRQKSLRQFNPKRCQIAALIALLIGLPLSHPLGLFLMILFIDLIKPG